LALARISVLISGRGSNLAALIAASREPGFPGAITHVVSNRGEAPGLAIAHAHGVATSVVDAGEPDLVVLAGFMRVLTAPFVERYAGRLLNIHPSLLPAYPGLHTHRRALADGVRVHGCTVHFVTPDVDLGPIVIQGVVPVMPGDDEASLASRVLGVEHRILPAAVRWFCAGELALRRGVVECGAAVDPAAFFVSPAVGRR
jgi:phosphoribosylglycinamide formyltransferase-1